MNARGSLPLALVLATLLPLTGCGGSGGTSSGTTGGGTAVSLKVLKGTARIARGSETIDVAAETGHRIEPGDTVVMDGDGEGILVCGAQVHVLEAGSETTVPGSAAPGTSLSRIEILKGLVTIFFPPELSKKHQFEAVTSTVVAAVKGTLFQVGVKGAESHVTVITGSVEVRAVTGGATRLLEKGERARVTGERIEVVPVPAPELQQARNRFLTLRTQLGVDITTY